MTRALAVRPAKAASTRRGAGADPASRPRDPAAASLQQARRQQILDAAAQCFRRRGFHAASMAEIAETFGMSAGHIYNYFAGKEAIIAAIIERDLGEALRRAEELRGAADLQGAILERVEPRVADRLDRSKSALQIEVMAEAGRNPRVAAMVQSADARTRAALRGVLRGASRSKRDLDGRVDVLMALFDGLMIRALRDPGIDRSRLTRVLRATIHSLLQG
jgi:AcrR family transcriptional regulator